MLYRAAKKSRSAPNMVFIIVILFVTNFAFVCPQNVIEKDPRSPRGASQEQWVQQPYPVHKTDQDEDSEGSDNFRAPKVHFVTQKRTEDDSGSRRNFRGRDRNFPSEKDRDFVASHQHRFRETPPEQESHNVFARERSYIRDFPPYEDFYPPRRSFNYFPQEQGFSNFQSFPPRKRYGRRYERYRHFDFERDNFEKPKKQTRIIYYATLPEVGRSPPKVNFRDRFNYNYDGYLNEPYFGHGGFREPFAPPPPYFKNEPKRLQPSILGTKFTKDLTVKEPKKVPESRIYSEAERRYADDFERFPNKNS